MTVITTREGTPLEPVLVMCKYIDDRGGEGMKRVYRDNDDNQFYTARLNADLIAGIEEGYGHLIKCVYRECS
jgi:hypothetical protein